MENTLILRKYELMFIVDAQLTNEDKEDVRKVVVEIIKKGGGKVINSQVWQEKHKFTFPIKKLNEGAYFIINFEGEGDCIEKIQPILKLNEKVLRFMTKKVD